MKKSSLAVLSIAGACLLALGCNGPDGHGVTGDEFELPVETMGGGPTIPNGATAACLSDQAIRASLEQIANDPIFSGGMSPTGLPLLNHVDVPAPCRHIIKDVVECALGTEQSVLDEDAGLVYTGIVGLAEEWEKEPLSQEQRRWVSACMIQRLNYFGMSIPILLEGAQTNILINHELEQIYPFAESTAWGNVFDGSAIGAFGYICTEEDVWSICPEYHGKEWIDTRVCDGVQGGVPNCGITFLGKCEDWCTPTADGYWVCPWQNNTWIPETIRVRMETNTHEPILGPCN